MTREQEDKIIQEQKRVFNWMLKAQEEKLKQRGYSCDDNGQRTLVIDLSSNFIDALEHPLENEDDEDATLCVTVRESGVKTTRLYSKHELDFETPSMWSDGTIKETEKLLLDKETRDCIVSGLNERLCQLKKELKDLLNE